MLSLLLCVFVVLLHFLISFSDSAYAWSDDPNVNTPICTEMHKQEDIQIISDGSGGAIITWEDCRWFPTAYVDIYAQRVTASGTRLWGPNGAPICLAGGHQSIPTLTTDGAGGAIITWYDKRSGTDYDIYAQRVLASAARLWTYNGEFMCTATNDQEYPQIISDGAGGAIITWQDERNGNYDIYAQWVTASGSRKWTTNGVAICIADNDQKYPTITTDGWGGAIITWRDKRRGYGDIYAQRVNALAAVQWGVNGLLIAYAYAEGENQYPQITTDGSGGAIITWEDYRNGTSPDYQTDIYAQRVYENGTIKRKVHGLPWLLLLLEE